MQIASYRAGDELLLARLYAGAAHQRFLDAWAWRHRLAPGSGEAPWALVAWEGEQVAGFASAVSARVVLGGQSCRGAQVAGGALARYPESPVVARTLHHMLVERLGQEGIQVIFGAVAKEQRPIFEELDFEPLFDVHARNLYVGLEGVSARLSKTAISPLRRFAREARRIRPKLVEHAFDAPMLEQLARLQAARAAEHGLAVEKSVEYLAWRYTRDPRHPYRLLIYRSRAGQGMDAFAVVRRFETAKGRAILHVDDHWTREPGRRAQAKLFGDLMLLGLDEEADVLRCFAPAGSSTEQALLGLGGIRRKVERSFMMRRLHGAPPVDLGARDVHLFAGDVELYET